VLTVLSRPECEALLARNMVGRIAFADRAHVDIVPISYVFIDGWLYGRADAPVRTAIRRNRWVAVEVAEVRDVRRWQSVVVRGGCYPVRGTGSPTGDAAARGVDLLRAKVPSIAPAGIDTAGAAIIYRIHADQVTGLRAAPSRSSRTLLARSFDEGPSVDAVERA
jgi:nitroimidazol reductase NimA-like FMN-containing flavoprotein (pyridoxamine 5'-phosphate oxidase superfamily)